MTTTTNTDLFISKCKEEYKQLKKDEITYIYKLDETINTSSTTKEEQIRTIISSIETIGKMFDNLFKENNYLTCVCYNLLYLLINEERDTDITDCVIDDEKKIALLNNITNFIDNDENDKNETVKTISDDKICQLISFLFNITYFFKIFYVYVTILNSNILPKYSNTQITNLSTKIHELLSQLKSFSFYGDDLPTFIKNNYEHFKPNNEIDETNNEIDETQIDYIFDTTLIDDNKMGSVFEHLYQYKDEFIAENPVFFRTQKGGKTKSKKNNKQRRRKTIRNRRRVH